MNQLVVVDTSCDCRACVNRTTKTYDLAGGCGNCYARFIVRSRIGDKPGYSVRCPNCGVTEYAWRRRPADGDAAAGVLA